MEQLKHNKLVWVCGFMLLLNIGGFFVSKVLVDKTADRVIEKLQRDYSPAKPPYGPGLNPDVISDEAFKEKSPVFLRRGWNR